MPSSVQIRPLTPSDAEAHRALMLAAYAREPRAFTSTAAEREALPLAWWARRLDGDAVWGAWDAQGRLLGAVGLEPHGRARTAHRATVFGLVVVPEARGQGLGRALLQALVDAVRQRPGLALLELTVSDGGPRHLYEDAGFVAWGREPMAVALEDGGHVDKWHLQALLHPPRQRLSLADAEVAEVRRDGPSWRLRLSAAPVQRWQEGRWLDGHLGPVLLRCDAVDGPDAADRLPRLWGRLREATLLDAQGQRLRWLPLPGAWRGPLRLALQDGHGQALELSLQGLCLQCPPDAAWRESLHC